ncbi:MAG TPA: hypothetical protein VK076_01085 [Candidatus Sphingobacterium stercoripullorum]|nr:hypothetical protein [Candidatus Sphingobacterium stercoripullorum]
MNRVERYPYLIFLIVMTLFLISCKEEKSNVGEGNDKKENIHDGEPLAFPTAEGFGKEVTGGRGGKVRKVTNLNDAGPGSLRAAVEAKDARIVVFDTSGTIKLESNLNIRNPNITIAGQTAPGDGITIRDYPVVVSTENVIIRYLRFRMGDDAGIEADPLGGFEQKDIIIDHCSVSWSTDECVSFYSNENFTMQWCIISESLRESAHDKGAHGYGGIFGGQKATFHHNLLAHHDSRNPRFGERGGTDLAKTSLVDYRNNVIYNWGGNTAYGGEGMNINLVNNYYKPGPASRTQSKIYSIDKSVDPNEPMYDIWGKYFIDGNYFEGNSEVTEDNWSHGVYNQFHHSNGEVTDADKDTMRIDLPHEINDNVRTQTPQEAYKDVLAFAGASLVRDAVDIRVLEEVKNGTFSAQGSSGSNNSRNGIIDSPHDVGGWPELKSSPALKDSDGDGMPDEWEIANGLDPNKYDANGRDLSKVYDNIEVYINSLVGEDLK